jgi:hypothetical protein
MLLWPVPPDEADPARDPVRAATAIAHQAIVRIDGGMRDTQCLVESSDVVTDAAFALRQFFLFGIIASSSDIRSSPDT